MDDILKKALARTAKEGKSKELKNKPPILPKNSPPTSSSPAPEKEKNFSTNTDLNYKKNFTGSPLSTKKADPKNKTKKEVINHKILDEHKIIYDCRANPASDQVKILRTQMLQRLLASGGNAVLITSPKPGEGKTVNTINLAISIAQEIDRTVLLIDANLRKPAVHKCFGLGESLGLADYLLGKASISEIMINPGIEKLTIIPGGSPLTTSSEMLGATRMADLVSEMKTRYADRILVFDGPDILTNADSQVFARLVDGVVLVVEAEKTARQDIKKAIELLGETPLIGTIFNKSHE